MRPIRAGVSVVGTGLDGVWAAVAVAAGWVGWGDEVAVTARGMAVAVGVGSPPAHAARDSKSPISRRKRVNLRTGILVDLLIP
jgi:hypothetical protein